MKNKKAGFTLIELLVVVSLSILLMLGASSMFMTFLLSRSKLSGWELIRNEGNQAIAQIEFLVRNATDILQNDTGDSCALDMPELKIKSLDGGTTSFLVETDTDSARKIASNSGTYLTSATVDIVQNGNGNYIEFDCSQSEDQRTKYVNVSFTLRKGVPGVDLERDIVEQEFTAGVLLRSF